jgi:hypothetical protein
MVNKSLSKAINKLWIFERIFTLFPLQSVSQTEYILIELCIFTKKKFETKLSLAQSLKNLRVWLNENWTALQ